MTRKEHLAYSKHITAEIEVEESVKGVLNATLRTRATSNHFLDASYMADVAASMKGIRLVKGRQPAAIDAAEWFGGNKCTSAKILTAQATWPPVANPTYCRRSGLSRRRPAGRQPQRDPGPVR